MATKKATTKSTAKPAAKKTTTKSAAKPAVKKTTAKKTTKPAAKKSTTTVEKVVSSSTTPKKKNTDIYNTNVSVLLAMAIEALILLLGYLIIMSVA